MNQKVTYHRASTSEELHQIIALQKENLPQDLSRLEKKEEGFVTVHHTLEILTKMNERCPHIIAKQNGNVIGYALCMHSDFANDITVLKPIFQEIKNVYKNENYIVMGQVCISKSYRKRGVFRGLYQAMSNALKGSFNSIVTGVNAKNIRSLNAHYAVGFKNLEVYHSAGQDWMLISLNI